jgi:hypothetical protein
MKEFRRIWNLQECYCYNRYPVYRVDDDTQT